MKNYIYGKNAVLEILKSNKKILSVIAMKNNKDVQVIVDKYRLSSITMYQDRKQMDILLKGKHQGIAVEIEPYQYAHLKDVLRDVSNRDLYLILDGLTDPHNLGAILRTADAVGVKAVIIPKNRSVDLTPTVAKVSTGAIEHIPVVKENLHQAIKLMKEHNIWIIGTDGNTEKEYTDLDVDIPLALVIGSEGKGISKLVWENCDFHVKIPMVGHVTSLNASVSAALMMYEVFNKRRSSEA